LAQELAQPSQASRLTKTQHKVTPLQSAPQLGNLDALLDRLVHSAYRIVMKGESLRRKKTEEEAAS
jgi:DNA replication protein DnaC